MKFTITFDTNVSIITGPVTRNGYTLKEPENDVQNILDYLEYLDYLSTLVTKNGMVFYFFNNYIKNIKSITCENKYIDVSTLMKNLNDQINPFPN
jgi:hypothetical protein